MRDKDLTPAPAPAPVPAPSLQLAFMFGAMQVAKRVPFDDHPEYITYARAAYVAAQLICVLIGYYCAFRVKKANDLTVLKYVEPKSPMVGVRFQMR